MAGRAAATTSTRGRSRAISAATFPDEPTIVVKNMPGASSGKAAQYITSIAPKDGTSMAGIMPGAIMGPLLDERSAPLFDPTKVQYIGTANNGTRVCVTMKGTKIGRFEDTRKVPAKFGGSGPNDSTFEYGYLHKRTAGAIYDVVAGYRGTPDMALAVERGEIDGVCGWDWSSFKSQKPDWLRDNKANVLLQVSMAQHPEFDPDGRAERVSVRRGRGEPQGGRAGHQPDRVPPLLHRTARDAARAA